MIVLLLNGVMWAIPAVLCLVLWFVFFRKRTAGLGAPGWMRTWVVPCWSAAFFVWLTAVTFARHRALQTHGCDLGIFENVLWNLTHGRGLTSSILHRPFLGEHVSPILYGLAPLYILWSDPRLLLLLQAGALAWAALPIYRIAARRLGPSAGCIFVAVYFAYLPLQGLYLFDFHEVAFVVPLLAYGLEALLRGRHLRMSVFLGLALLCKEEVALSVVTFGLALALFPRAAGPLAPGAATGPRRRLGVTMALAGAVLFLLLTGWVLPYFRGAAFPYVDRYSHLGGTLSEIAVTGLTAPARVWRSVTEPEKIRFLGGLSLPVLCLNWFSPVCVLLFSPTLARCILSNHAPQYGLRFHFLAPMVPFIFAGAAISARRFCCLRLGAGTSRCSRRAVCRARLALLLIALFVAGVGLGVHPGSVWEEASRGSRRYRALQQLVAAIPGTASVCAHNGVAAHVAGRAGITVYPDVRGADWVLLDFREAHTEYPLTREEDTRRLLQLVRGGGYAVEDCREKLVLLKRTDEAGQIPVEELITRLFLRSDADDVQRIAGKTDRRTMKRFPDVAHAGNRLYPAGEYAVFFRLRTVRPLDGAAGLHVLVHPRWGELTGDWALTGMAIRPGDISVGTEQEFMLEFRLSVPTFLSLQVIGGGDAGVEVLGIEVRPAAGPESFCEDMFTMYDQLSGQ